MSVVPVAMISGVEISLVIVAIAVLEHPLSPVAVMLYSHHVVMLLIVKPFSVPAHW